MGMIGNYLRVTQKELENYLSESSLLEDRVYGDDNINDNNLIDVDKSWEGLFFLLTGQSLETSDKALSPLLWILAPPQVIDPEQEMGYSPALYTTPDQTKEVYFALKTLTNDNLSNKFNSQQMMEMRIYPEIWNENEALDYLIENFNSLKEFYSKAATENQAVIVFIN